MKHWIDESPKEYADRCERERIYVVLFVFAYLYGGTAIILTALMLVVGALKG